MLPEWYMRAVMKLQVPRPVASHLLNYICKRMGLKRTRSKRSPLGWANRVSMPAKTVSCMYEWTSATSQMITSFLWEKHQLQPLINRGHSDTWWLPAATAKLCFQLSQLSLTNIICFCSLWQMNCLLTCFWLYMIFSAQCVNECVCVLQRWKLTVNV